MTIQKKNKLELIKELGIDFDHQTNHGTFQ